MAELKNVSFDISTGRYYLAAQTQIDTPHGSWLENTLEVQDPGAKIGLTHRLKYSATHKTKFLKLNLRP